MYERCVSNHQQPVWDSVKTHSDITGDPLVGDFSLKWYKWNQFLRHKACDVIAIKNDFFDT